MNKSNIKIIEEEVLSFPVTQKRLDAIDDPECALYMGNAEISHNKRTLYVAFRLNGKNGLVERLYKVKAVFYLNLSDKDKLKAIAQQESGISDISDRIKKYISITGDNFTGNTELFMLDLDNSVKLPIPARYEHRAPQKIAYHSISDFTNDIQTLDGKKYVIIPHKKENVEA